MRDENVYCKKFKATFFSRICLLRQDIAEEKKKQGENLTSFSKCSNCMVGKKIRMNPDNKKIDRDARKLLRLYLPKPDKYELVWKKPIRKELRKPIKYNLKGDN